MSIKTIDEYEDIRILLIDRAIVVFGDGGPANFIKMLSKSDKKQLEADILNYVSE